MSGRFGLRIATVLVLLLGAWRLLSLVAHEPIYGYANQFDMSRTSACLDLWPAASTDASVADLAAATPAAPLAQYQIRVLPEQPCYYSSEAAFDRAVLWLRALTSDSAALDLRVIGLCKAWALLLSAAFCGALFWRSPVAGFAHAAIFTLVLCDPMVSLYANSLYTEFCAVWGAYVFLSCFAAYALRRADAIEPRMAVRLAPSAIGAAIGMAILSASRVPNAALSVVLCAIALVYLWRWRASKYFAAGLVLSSAIGVAVAMHNQHGSESIQRANAANTLLFTFLPATADPTALMRQLGLPESCQRYGFSSWYLARGVAISEPCQQIYGFSRARLALGLLREPKMGVRVLANAFAQSRGWRVRYMGEVGGAAYQRAPHWSLADVVPRLPYLVYVFALFLALGVVFAQSGIALVLDPERRALPHWRCLQSLSALLAVLLIFPLLISLLGDGYTELPRYAHLSSVVVVPIFLLGALGAIALYRERGRRVIWVIGIVLSGAMLCALGLTRQASALGIWEHALWAQSTHTINGSVIDPYSVTSAYAKASGHADQPLTTSQPGKDVAQVFQGYPASTKVQGQIEVHAPYTEIVVRNSLGVETVVDRVWADGALE